MNDFWNIILNSKQPSLKAICLKIVDVFIEKDYEIINKLIVPKENNEQKLIYFENIHTITSEIDYKSGIFNLSKSKYKYKRPSEQEIQQQAVSQYDGILFKDPEQLLFEIKLEREMLEDKRKSLISDGDVLRAS